MGCRETTSTKGVVGGIKMAGEAYRLLGWTQTGLELLESEAHQSESGSETVISVKLACDGNREAWRNVKRNSSGNKAFPAVQCPS